MTTRAKAAPARFDLDYAPAPEATDHVKLREHYGLLIGGKWVEPRSERHFKTVDPATEQALAEVAEAGEEDVDLAVRAARSAYTRVWAKTSGAERAKYLYRVARILQERAREFAVLETIDGGKPIKESRDVDVPLAAAHFFYYAGWADKLEYAFPGRTPSGRAGDPVELPAADGRLEAGAGAGRRQHRGAQAGGDDAAHRAAARPGARAGRAAARGGQHRHGGWRDGRGGRFPRRRRQGRLHRLDRGGQVDPAHPGRQRQAADARARRQGGQRGLRRRGRRPGGRGDRQRDLLQPGPRLLRGLAPAGAGVDRRGAGRQAQAPHGDAAGGGPPGQEHRRRRDQFAPAAREDPGPGRLRRGGGRGAVPAALRAAEPRVLVPADGVHRCRPVLPHRPGGDFRAGVVGADLQDPGRGGVQGQQHALRAVGGGLDREGQPHPRDGEAAARRGGVGQHLQPFRPGVSVRRLPGVRLRPRGRPSRPGRLPGAPAVNAVRP